MHSTISPALTPPLDPKPSVLSTNDIRHLSSLQSIRDSSKPQEQGNTKKKRRSLAEMENTHPRNEPNQSMQMDDEQGGDTGDEGLELGGKNKYGDPLKIAKFFGTELN